MATQAFLGKGTQLRCDFGSGFVTIAEVRSISGPTLTAAQVDVSNMDSGDFVEKIRGLIDPGEVTFEMNWFAHSSQESLFTDFVAGTARDFEIRFTQFTPAERLDFNGTCTAYPFNIPTDSQVTANITITVSGAVSRVTEP